MEFYYSMDDGKEMSPLSLDTEGDVIRKCRALQEEVDDLKTHLSGGGVLPLAAGLHERSSPRTMANQQRAAEGKMLSEGGDEQGERSEMPFRH